MTQRNPTGHYVELPIDVHDLMTWLSHVPADTPVEFSMAGSGKKLFCYESWLGDGKYHITLEPEAEKPSAPIQ